MPAPYTILVSPRCKREILEHPELLEVIERLKIILTEDPYNLGRQHDTKKLKMIVRGEGQWRIRAGKYRLRYDIIGQEVILYSFRHRKEAY